MFLTQTPFKYGNVFSESLSIQYLLPLCAFYILKWLVTCLLKAIITNLCRSKYKISCLILRQHKQNKRHPDVSGLQTCFPINKGSVSVEKWKGTPDQNRRTYLLGTIILEDAALSVLNRGVVKANQPPQRTCPHLGYEPLEYGRICKYRFTQA